MLDKPSGLFVPFHVELFISVCIYVFGNVKYVTKSKPKEKKTRVIKLWWSTIDNVFKKTNSSS